MTPADWQGAWMGLLMSFLFPLFILFLIAVWNSIGVWALRRRLKGSPFPPTPRWKGEWHGWRDGV